MGFDNDPMKQQHKDPLSGYNKTLYDNRQNSFDDTDMSRSSDISSPQSFTQQRQYSEHSSSLARHQDNQTVDRRDIEILSAKLDALKANLDNINQRLTSLQELIKNQHTHNFNY